MRTSLLKSLDPREGLDDLEPLRDVVGDARVLAIGEGAHFVDEFSQVRQRVARFLAERCGFTVFALEYSFPAAGALDAWLHGRDDRPLAEVAPAAAGWGAAGLMSWLREHNTGSRFPLRFAGIDLPEAAGALRPVLEPLADLLAEADPDAAGLAREAIVISDEFLAGLGSGAAAAPAWAALPAARQDALTATLSRLQLRLSAVRPLLTGHAADAGIARAERLLAGARTTDYLFRAMNDLQRGEGRTADMSVRESYLAETLAWQLREAGPGARVVVAAHNNHIQKTAAVFDGHTVAFPMGQHLARMLGEDYVAVAVTHTAAQVPEMRPDASSPVGFTVVDADLPQPAPGSIEHALGEAGLAGEITLTDLRQAPAAGLDGIRTQSAVIRTPLPDAFDAVISTPTVTRDRTVTF